ncbi:MAG: NTF2-like N-terminal transpeptidase domain-containing protein [Candidatus Humimicrobiaceae bacterium]
MSKARNILLISVLILIVIFSCSCSFSNIKMNAAYILKTDPEKSVIDFLKYLNAKTPLYIYDNLLSVKDKDRISKDKFIEELNLILSDIDEIVILKTTYLGFEDKGGLVKVVTEFEIKYKNSEINKYKKYVYLVEENKKWKIVFEKTFI